MELTETTICERLNRKYTGNCKYKLASAFIFKHDWESDFFVQKVNGYCYEFEVKISRSDFFNDKKKIEKHLILETGKYNQRSTAWNEETKDYNIVNGKEVLHNYRPNKFFYVVPENLIRPDEVPKYAGLMYVPMDKYKDIITIKEAPFIHKNVLEFEKVLCKKFYYYWLDMKRKVNELEYQIKNHLNKHHAKLHNP